MRLFVAVDCGDEVRAAATAVRRTVEAEFARHGGEPPRIVWVAPPGLHVTLRFLGERPDAEVPALAAAIDAGFELSPFSIGWRGVGAFPSPRRPRTLWIGIDRGARELGVLESELARRLGALLPGEQPDQAAAFHPHVTVARVKTDHGRANWPAILDAIKISATESAVDHVSLYRSRGLPGGAGYEEIARGGLRGRR